MERAGWSDCHETCVLGAAFNLNQGDEAKP